MENMSLKRSGVWKLVETLNVFGIHADYMRQFKEFLKREGVPTENIESIELPTIKNLPKTKLKTLRLKNGVEFKKNAPKSVLTKGAGNVTLDCYAKIQFVSSVDEAKLNVINKQDGNLSDVVKLLDINFLWIELIRYKRQKGYDNISIPLKAITSLLVDSSWYKLYIPQYELEIKNYVDVARITKITMSLLEKYLVKFYNTSRNNWEANVVGYEATEIDENDENIFPEEQIITTTDENLINWLNKVKIQLENFKSKNSFDKFIEDKFLLKVFGFDRHLYNPLIYNNNEIGITVSPTALKESEYIFVSDLQKFVKDNQNKISTEIYLLRNQSRKGVGFFEENGFYPDFILWIIKDGLQYITFIDPHGMRNEGFKSNKVQLYQNIKNIQNKLDDKTVILNSFILSYTKYVDIPKDHTQEEWNENNVLFMEQEGYIDKIFYFTRK
jgi:hypothetical protein